MPVLNEEQRLSIADHFWEVAHNDWPNQRRKQAGGLSSKWNAIHLKMINFEPGPRISASCFQRSVKQTDKTYHFQLIIESVTEELIRKVKNAKV